MGKGKRKGGASWPVPGSAHKSGQQYVEIQRMPTAGNCWRRPAACLLPSAPFYLLDEARAGYVCLFALPCLLYYIQTLRRPGQEASIWPTNARHGAWVRCNSSLPPPATLPLPSDFPIDFSLWPTLTAVWACGARTDCSRATRHLQTPCSSKVSLYLFLASINRRVDKAYPFSLHEQIRANAIGRGI